MTEFGDTHIENGIMKKRALGGEWEYFVWDDEQCEFVPVKEASIKEMKVQKDD